MVLHPLFRKRVHTLPPEATCEDAALLMRERNVGCVVVAEGNRPVGVVTDRDLVVWVIADGQDPGEVCLGDVMSDEPIFLGSHQSVEEMIAAMRDLAVRRLPIVDETGELCGLVSMDDLIVLLADQISSLADAVQGELGSAAK